MLRKIRKMPGAQVANLPERVSAKKPELSINFILCNRLFVLAHLCRLAVCAPGLRRHQFLVEKH